MYEGLRAKVLVSKHTISVPVLGTRRVGVVNKKGAQGHLFMTGI